jgi:hypothetical protein
MMMKLTFIVLLLAIIPMAGNAQAKSELCLYTDRNVYVSGETLLTKIYTPEDNSSKIVYMDLINKHGIRILGASLELRNFQANGYLQLPDSLSSGTYELRAYQKNTAGNLQIIHEIWISNRFDGFEKTNQMKKLVVSEIKPEILTNQIILNNLKAQYSSRDTVIAGIEIEQSLLNQIDGELLVAAAQIDSSFISSTFISHSLASKAGMNEDKGIILSGTVTDKKTLQPVENVTVYITIPDSVPGFQYYKTEKDGRFYFLLDQYYGSVQAVIQCFDNLPTQRVKIKMDELFAESGVQPKYIKQSFPETLKENISRNIDAVTLQKVFNQEKLKITPALKEIHEEYPYYGKPTQIIDPQLFIDLPNFTEISRELLPGVKFRNFNNEPSMQVINSSVNKFFEDKPLILIDGIPISDLNVIKGMGTADIDRVEICQNERFFGDLRFQGVVAIYTTKADYSIIPESDQLVRLKLEAIQIPAKLTEPQLSEPNIPDLRQLLYWEPSVIPQHKLRVKFTASSVTGLYKLVVMGRLKNRTVIFSERQFEIK